MYRRAVGALEQRVVLIGEAEVFKQEGVAGRLKIPKVKLRNF
ncbi:MAG: hypothetical protein ACYC2T_06610 [Bacillota bacterium]